MEYTRDGRTYQLAGNLTKFQLGLYMHLADWAAWYKGLYHV